MRANSGLVPGAVATVVSSGRGSDRIWGANPDRLTGHHIELTGRVAARAGPPTREPMLQLFSRELSGKVAELYWKHWQPVL
jgi:hypothetical protein